MSNQVHFKGMLVPIHPKLPLEQACRKLIFEMLGTIPLSADSWQQLLTDSSLLQDYTIINKLLYHIIQYEIPNMDTFIAYDATDNTIKFEVSYYDGSTSHNEALQQAVNNMIKIPPLYYP